MTDNNTSLVRQSNFVAAIASYLHLFNAHLIKTDRSAHALELFLTSKQKLHEVACQPQLLGSLAFQKEWIKGQKLAFRKETRKEPKERMVTQLLFLWYQPNCHKGLTFPTTRCSFQLTQHILTLCARRSLKATNFIDTLILSPEKQNKNSINTEFQKVVSVSMFISSVSCLGLTP